MNLKKLTAAAAVLAAAGAPMTFAKGKPEDPGSQGKANKPAKMKNVVLKGAFVSTDGTTIVVDVPKSKGKGNKKPSGQITVDVSKANFVVADTNANGPDVTDLGAGDKLVVQTRADGKTFIGRRVVDQTHPPVADSTDTNDAPNSGAAPNINDSQG